MEEQRFDELTRLIAQKTSRRQMLKVLAGATVGGFLLQMDPRRAFASNSACAHFCNTAFGADTPAAAQCTSDAAHHRGLCYSACGPGGTGGTVCGGACIDTTSDSNNCGACGNVCSSGQTCTNGTCTATCQKNPYMTCQGNATIATVNGTTTCVKTCTSNADCTSGTCEADADGVHSYCTGGGCSGCNNFYCSSDANCDPGTFCSNYPSGYQAHTCTNAVC